MTIAVGIIGTGALGEPIAGRLLEAGFAVCVCDVRRDPVERLARLGARLCTSAAEVARHSDIVVSLVILILAAPLIALTALAVKLESRGPALFRQRRVGLYGE